MIEIVGEGELLGVGHCGYSQVSKGREGGIVDGTTALQCMSGEERVEIEFSVRVKPYSVLQFFYFYFYFFQLFHFSFSFPLSFFFFFSFYLSSSSTSLLLYFSLIAEGRVRCVNSLWREAKQKKKGLEAYLTFDHSLTILALPCLLAFS